MTNYIVFQQENGAWVETGRVEARSANASIREVLAGSTEHGVFAAVPARSWKPVKVSVETKTALKFS